MADIIHGATGAQGSPVLSALTSAGRSVVAAVRHPEAVPDGIAVRQVDLVSVDSLASTYEGADGVFVHLPMGAPEVAAAQARAVVEAVTRAHPGRVIISTSGQIVDQPGSPLQAPVDSPIMTLIDGVTGSGVPTAVVAPRLYLENLLLPVVLGPVREEGVLRYPLPASFPVSWSSHLDVAEVVARLLTDASPTTGTVGVGHLPGLTGRIWPRPSPAAWAARSVSRASRPRPSASSSRRSSGRPRRRLSTSTGRSTLRTATPSPRTAVPRRS